MLAWEAPSGKSGSVTIAPASGGFTYTCYYGGEVVEEENEAGSKRVAERLWEIDVEAAELGHDESGKEVVWYIVNTTRTTDRQSTRVHRRFRDFWAFNDQIRSAYKGSALFTSLPDMPSRTFKFLSNQRSPEFIEERRHQLHEFMIKLMQVPRVATNPDFCVFVGILDGVRESSVRFAPGPLGLTVGKDGDHVGVLGFKALPDGSVSPAESAGCVQIGDRLSKVNGADVLDDSYAMIVNKIKTAKRPMIIHFLGYATSTATSSPAADATATDDATADEVGGGGGGGSDGGSAGDAGDALDADAALGAAADATDAGEEA
jgi:hypothetical protein